MDKKATYIVLDHSEFAFTDIRDEEKLAAILTNFPYAFHVEQPERLWYANRLITSMKPLLEAATGFGHVTSTPDSDGVLRRVPLVIRVKDQLLPHMALTAIIRYLQVAPQDVVIIPGKHILLRNARYPGATFPQDIKIPVDERCRLRVNFPPSIEPHAFAAVLEAETDLEAAKAWKSELEGKICTIGYTATGTGDIGPIPYEAQFPYALLHAAVMNTILTQNFFIEVSTNWMVLITLLIAVGSTFAAPRLSPMRFMIVVISVVISYISVAIVLFIQYNIILKLVYPVIPAVLLAYTLIIAYWYIKEERKRNQLRPAFKT